MDATFVAGTPLLSFVRPPGKRVVVPRATVSASPVTKAASYQLREGQSRLFHRLSSGLAMEVIFQEGQKVAAAEEGRRTPPLVFVHGSFHAAWCWAERWLPFFSDSGYDCYALSLLGQVKPHAASSLSKADTLLVGYVLESANLKGESDVPLAATVAGTLQTHSGDVADFIRKEVKSPPVMVGHSFGGLIVQSYISNMEDSFSSDQSSLSENHSSYPLLAGAALICSVPPTGNRYQELMKVSSKLPLFDLRKLNAALPVPSPGKGKVKLLILGASDDFIVDAKGLQETSRFYNVQPVCVSGVAHDMMLDSLWEKGAQILLVWLRDFDEVA
ncbi:hypothetical protein ZIOFF_071728 [Zingiber officinale]|uniref:AB hydrolase-1 domain-containing protein n=1 Tax=Zingiber officinale TaxID=94328 RepID=A0A8J5BEL0_ZINOF|nr:hypothetical protein ZIOFF_071728 [Zingiber officinale]